MPIPRRGGVWYRVWHRRAGICSALVLLLVAITGLALNHTQTLELASKPVRWEWLLSHYGVRGSEQWRAYSYEGGYLAQDGGGALFVNKRLLPPCRGAVLGAGVVASMGATALACTEELMLFNEGLELIERLGSGYGLPLPLNRAGTCGDRICVQQDDGRVQQLDLQSLGSVEYSGQVAWWEPVSLPDDLQSYLRRETASQFLHWERVMLDLHSGRVAGTAGVLVVDLSAIILIFLCVSGLWIWLKPRYLRK